MDQLSGRILTIEEALEESKNILDALRSVFINFEIDRTETT